jgi:hypothetical protein
MWLGHGVSEIELGVDRQRGILLRQALLLDERPYQVTELVEVAFDESFPAETFTFVLPPGETPRLGDEPEARGHGRRSCSAGVVQRLHARVAR